MKHFTLLVLSGVLLLPGILRADDTANSSGTGSVTVPASSGAVPQFRPPPASTATTSSAFPSALGTPTHQTRHKKPIAQGPSTLEQQTQARTLTQSLNAYNVQQWATFKAIWTAQENTVLTDSALSAKQKQGALAQLKLQEQAATVRLNQQLKANAEQKWAALRHQWSEIH